MKKYIIITLIIIALVLGYNMYSNSNALPEKINVNQVASITISGEGIKARTANAEETKNIINWYNSITDIRRNWSGNGGMGSSTITIQLKQNENPREILILDAGLDFEIQGVDKKGNLTSYKAKQSDIEQLLLEAAKK